MQQSRQRFEAENFLRLGAQQIDDGQFQGAQQSFQSALDLYQHIQDSEGIGASLYNLGFAYRRLNQFDEAIVCYQQVLQISEKVGSTPVFLANLLKNLGLTYISNSDFQAAFSVLHSALHLYLQQADRRGEAEVTLNIGICCHHMNFPQEANTCYRTALHITHLLNDPALEASFRQTIAPPSQPHDL